MTAEACWVRPARSRVMTSMTSARCAAVSDGSSTFSRNFFRTANRLLTASWHMVAGTAASSAIDATFTIAVPTFLITSPVWSLDCRAERFQRLLALSEAVNSVVFIAESRSR
jgi:hypothetical protein